AACEHFTLPAGGCCRRGVDAVEKSRISGRPHSWYSRSSQSMELTMIRKAFGVAGMAAALLAAPAFAHHSFSMFDQSKVLYKSGTVKQLELVNPHAWLNIVVNDKGEPATWSFEGGSVPQLLRLGWSKDSFKAGDEIEVGFR